MEYWVSLIYGIVQGITEFLPVSSSGHLALIPRLLQVEDPGVFFDLSMHLGTALAVILYFRDQVWLLISGFFKLFIPGSSTSDYNRPFVLNMLVATASTFVLVLALRYVQGDWIRHPLFISLNLIIFGVLMYVADLVGKNRSISMRQSFHFWKAFSIGAAQAFAIFPGVSRSGITLTAARSLGIGRHDAGEFSFLLSLPIIIGGFFIELLENSGNGIIFDYHQIVIGLLASFVVGLITIHFFLKLISKIGLAPFALYRVVFAIAIYWLLS